MKNCDSSERDNFVNGMDVAYVPKDDHEDGHQNLTD